MNSREILGKADHTQLSVTATWDEIRRVCDDGMRYQTASICIPPCYVKQAKEYVGDRLAICTVIGFPNGYMTTAAKVYETKDSVANGADEIDMVIPIGRVKAQEYAIVLDEIKAVRKACQGKVLKVIVETCLLTEEEKIRMCELVSLSGADYIKTSTGFSTGGATREDVALFREHSKPHVRIKAAGGISTMEDAEDFLSLGADRLGTSRIVKLVKEHEE